MDTPSAVGDSAVTVPVLIDARREIDGVKVVRAMYLVLTSETLVPGGLVQTGRNDLLPIPVLGQMGVIYRPNNEATAFTDPGQLETLFVTLESELGYLVELEDIWIPENWFHHRTTINRGELYRLAFDLFEACYQYRSGVTTQISGLADLRPSAGEVAFSTTETEVFREWNQQQIQDAIEIYPKYGDYALKWDEAKSYS